MANLFIYQARESSLVIKQVWYDQKHSQNVKGILTLNNFNGLLGSDLSQVIQNIESPLFQFSQPTVLHPKTKYNALTYFCWAKSNSLSWIVKTC